MLIYNYDSITKEYSFSSEANLDQLETINKGKSVYIIPNNATQVRPLATKQGFTQCYDEIGKTWFYVEDHRGQIVYSKDDLSELTINTIGPIPIGYMEQLPSPKNKYQVWIDGSYQYPNIEDLRTIIKQDLDERYNDKIAHPYKVGKYYVQPEWATIYTNTLVAMQDDINADGKLDETYRILLITDPVEGNFHHLQVNSIDEFMPFYKKVKEKYKEITEDYHDKIIRIAKGTDPEVIVSIILTY